MNKPVNELVPDLLAYLRSYHQLATPNLKIVYAIIEEYKSAVEAERRRLAEEIERQRLARLEAERIAALKK